MTWKMVLKLKPKRKAGDKLVELTPMEKVC